MGAVLGGLVGGGVGYMDDRAADKQVKRAQTAREHDFRERQAKEQAAIAKATISSDPKTAYRPKKDNPLVGSSWRVISYVDDKDPVPDFYSMVVTFTTNTRLTTLTAWGDGHTEVAAESYQLLDDVIVLVGDDYVVNAKFTIDDNQMIVVSPEMRLVLEKV